MHRTQVVSVAGVTDRVGHAEPIKFFQWLDATLVGFVGLLILNGLL
jgi:hypothetical protein